MEKAASWRLTQAHRPIKSSTLAMDSSRIEQHIKPLLGKRVAETLKIADIEAIQSDIAIRKTAKPRTPGRGGVTKGGAGVASRSVATLQSILNHAVQLDIIASNQGAGARKIAGKKKENINGPAPLLLPEQKSIKQKHMRTGHV
mgnify:CR=1 FL=1